MPERVRKMEFILAILRWRPVSAAEERILVERGDMNELLGFKEEGLKGLHFFIRDLDYPLVVGEYTPKDAYAIRCLNESVRKGGMNSEQICEWCINHRIYYRLLYGIRISHILRDPLKAVEFVKMRGRLKMYAAGQ